MKAEANSFRHRFVIKQNQTLVTIYVGKLITLLGCNIEYLASSSLKTTQQFLYDGI